MALATETRTDTQIQADVLAELKWEPRVSPNEIGVSVKDGVVTLTGWVDSYTKRWAAEDAAHRVQRVLVLRALDQEHHHERHHVRDGVDDQLPGVREREERTSDHPRGDDDQRADERRGASGPFADPRGEPFHHHATA
jgi:hypothetical protein